MNPDAGKLDSQITMVEVKSEDGQQVLKKVVPANQDGLIEVNGKMYDWTIVQHSRRFVDFEAVEWPDEPGFELFCDGYRLHVSRYRARNKDQLLVKPKAILFYVHGYGAYFSRLAFLAKMLAQ